jgi:zinc transport system substrate-binding protein
MAMRFVKLFGLVLLSACTGEKSDFAQPAIGDQAGPVSKVVTSNYPLYYFATEIAGNTMDVRFPAITGDPALWTPTGEEAVQLQGADLIIINGAGYESWMDWVTLPEHNILNTSEAMQDRLVPILETSVHQHGPRGEHSHQGTAFTTWLDPSVAAAQATVIAQAFSRLHPRDSETHNANLEVLKTNLQKLDHSFETAFSALASEPVVFSHPVYQYLQNRYRINGVSVHWEPDQAPGVKDWIDLQNLLREHPARLMIWEDQPLQEVKSRLMEMGVRSIVFHPAGNRPLQGNYLSVMEENIDEINSTLQKNSDE